MLLATALITIIGCKKDAQPSQITEQEVSFNLNSVSENGGLKSTNVLCYEGLKADYVKYKIGTGDFKMIPVFYVGNLPWTSSIKLMSGDYTLTEFLVYNNGPDGITNNADDVLISAVPHTGASYAQYVTTPLAKTFTVTTDKKTEVVLDVVCFNPQNFDNFGFEYFQMNEITVRQLWFFGDFCIKDKADYAGSQYAQQSNWSSVAGLFIDAPAISKVEVYKRGVLVETFTNSAQGEKLSVTYADDNNVTEAFVIKLYILVKEGAVYNYVLFKEWSFNDNAEGTIPHGVDGVVDYVLGNCYDPSTPPDVVFLPWMNLPKTATYKIIAWNPSHVINGVQGYVDAELSNINPNGSYDINNGTYASFCADHSTNITVGSSYAMDVYSSLSCNLPAFCQDNVNHKWNKINWLFNNLDRYPGYVWSDLQGFIWLYDNPVWNGQPNAGMPALSAMTTQMYSDAQNPAICPINYTPLPGGWAAVIFVPAGTPTNAPTATLQTMFIQIDP